MEQPRVIFHLDLNAFFASVEQALDPRLRNRPVAVAGDPKQRRGIVVTCSYEARAAGVQTGMTAGEARRRCPELICVAPQFHAYREASAAMFAVLRSVTPLVEPVSIDEGYLDVTDAKGPGSYWELALSLQHRLLADLDLPSSIGIAPNKFLAKMASGMRKPLGITALGPAALEERLWPLAIERMHGVGEKTAAKLRKLRIETIGDLAAAEEGDVRLLLGKTGSKLWSRARGEDERPVDPDSIYRTKSVGNSRTLPADESDRYALCRALDALCETVSARLDAKQLVGRTVCVHVRAADWTTASKSRTFRRDLDSAEELSKAARLLFDACWTGEPVRLLGVSVQNVERARSTSEQLTLFNWQEAERDQPVLHAVRELQQKYGSASIQRGVARPKRQTMLAPTSLSRDFLGDHFR